MNLETSLGGFLEQLGSDSPAPGGGSAAALAGATAAALCEMVCRLTLARESCREAWPDMRRALGEAARRGARLRELIREDADAYLSVVSARALPRGTAEEKTERKRALQEATLLSARVPLETLENLRAVAELVALLVARGNANCITDAGTAGALCRAGAVAADYNVRVNLPSISDDAPRLSLRERTRAALADITAAADRIARECELRLDQRSTS